MRAHLLILAVCSVTLAACGGGPPGPAGLAYSLPDPAVLTYVTGDTATWDVGAGGQNFQMTINSSATMAASFARAADGVQVTLTAREFSGRMTNPMSAPLTADKGEIEGDLVFTLDRRGNPEVISQPDVRDGANRFFGSLATAHSFFPRLPGRAVNVGDVWTDTIRFEGPQGPGEVSSASVATYAVVGDTVVGGRSVLRLDVSGTRERTEKGNIQGVDLSVMVTGTIAGHVFWDAQRGVMAESYLEEDLTGSMEVSMVPVPLEVRIRGQSRSVLQN